MVRTVTVRVSVVLGCLLLVVGSGVFAYGAYEGATKCDYGSGISLDLGQENANEADPPRKVSELPPDRRGLFLLALSNGDRYVTRNDELQRTASTWASSQPSVRYDGMTYTVSKTTHVDCAPGGRLQLWGVVGAIAGSLTLIGACITSLGRRL